MPLKPTPKAVPNANVLTKRRRESSRYQAIMAATRELAKEKGIRGLNLKLIASRANVSRNVLYNWWGGEISRIVEDALLPKVSEWPTPNNGNFKDDLEELLERSIEAVHNPTVLKGFLFLAAEVARDNDKLDDTSRHFRAPYAKLVQRIIKNAEQRGEVVINPDNKIDTKLIAQIMSGSILQLAISQSLGKRQTKRALSDVVCKLVLP